MLSVLRLLCARPSVLVCHRLYMRKTPAMSASILLDLSTAETQYVLKRHTLPVTDFSSRRERLMRRLLLFA